MMGKLDAQRGYSLWPDEPEDIREDVRQVVRNADTWLETPNDQLGGLRPEELIGTEHEIDLRNLLRSVKMGMFT
jgi:hypothetical protein